MTFGTKFNIGNVVFAITDGDNFVQIRSGPVEAIRICTDGQNIVVEYMLYGSYYNEGRIFLSKTEALKEAERLMK